MLFFLSSNETFSADLSDTNSFRCQKGIVSLGEPIDSVLKKCGEPSMTDKFRDKWMYDRGRSYPVYYLKFSGGTVLRISSGGKGEAILKK